MIDPQHYALLKQVIVKCMQGDYGLLEQLRRDIRPLRGNVQLLQPRNTTSIALVATDGGNNYLRFDPFLIQLVRVVDSSENELYFDVVTPSTNLALLSQQQFLADGRPATPLGELMAYLQVRDLSQLSRFLPASENRVPRHPAWIQVYRELVEWAVLFSLIQNKQFGTDTVIIFDGLLRSKVFAGDFFQQYLRGIYEGIARHWHHDRRKLYLAGVAKHSKVLARYRLAMALEGVLTTDYPAYLAVPNTLEKSAYAWIDYPGTQFVGGKMFFAKFGSSPHAPIWPIDILAEQVTEAPLIIGCMLTDALGGFPVPLYPQCLQRAHAHAALVDFDFEILQDQIFDGMRHLLAEEAPILDTFRFQDPDPSRRRYE